MNAHPKVDERSILGGLRRVFLAAPGNVGGDFILRDPIRLSDGKSINGADSTEIAGMITRLNQAKSKTESSFQWESEAEFSLVSLSPFSAFDRIFDDTTFPGQGENPVTFKVGRPSREFAAYLLCAATQNSVSATPAASVRQRAIMRRAAALGIDRISANRSTAETASLFDVVAEGLRATTLRITAAKSHSDFETLANSFLFHAAYNTDAAARIGLEPMFRTQSIQRVRRNQNGSFDGPRQTYDADLVHHYLMGVAAEIPLLEYLSYYHIAEHFFEKVFNEDLVNQVRSGIIDPSFSARRNKDIQSIIRIVTKVQRQVKDEGGVNEQRALQLALNRFVNIPRLVADLDAYDSSLIDYYANNDVPFAGASKVNIRMHDEEGVRDAIAKRIYKVRNALVHAKEGELPKYAPFAHDEELAREIPLMRFAAEQIVIARGKVL
ncbi:hypothetical protein [Streptomyces rishiriensis]|uniref:Apea-like HEPN domain-containing protein n=1 Tax=Streptomyces rishiriensis TaxID=68264 RepID=A0ABU0NXK3_STRRH|nr:hypothetical protein [Streptomyces rishiriensis]MDQ0583433.1 hypothetical protein [Streptomyces rishiriensis]